VTAAEAAAPISAAEADALFSGLASAEALLLAVSGGPDSTALMVLASRWRGKLKRGPKLFAATVDHGLRAESAREARAVKQLAQRLGIPHRTLRWAGAKPPTGLQEAARAARYGLLAAAARNLAATCVLTAHTLDDQAETVLLRMARGSGPSGLAAMARETLLPEATTSAKSPRRSGVNGLVLVRPLLEVPKARLIATLDAARIPFCEDPSNRDPRFTRARLRELMPLLAGEGLDAERLGLLARRLRRVEAAIEFAVTVAAAAVADAEKSKAGGIRLDAEKFIRLPAEVALRLLGRAIHEVAGAPPARLNRLEALYDLLAESASTPRRPDRVRHTLGGAMMTLAGGRLSIERAPARRGRSLARTALTTRPHGLARDRKPR
jgi:tRNA(Ile)-lysidine synthase